MIALWRAAVVLVLLGLWELAIAIGYADPFWVSRPTAIAAKLWTWTVDGTLLWHAPVTFLEAAMGLLLGAAIGIPAGFVLASLRRVDLVVTPLLAGLNSVPRIALAPLFILWFGLGFPSKVVLAVTLVAFVLYLNTYAGARSVPSDQLMLMRVLGANQLQVWQKITLPFALVWIISALRAGLSLAVLGAVVGELIGSSQGLGFLTARSSGIFDIAGLFAALTTLGAGAMLLDRAAVWLQAKLTPWLSATGPYAGT